jgi:hypothetical protein
MLGALFLSCGIVCGGICFAGEEIPVFPGSKKSYEQSLAFNNLPVSGSLYTTTRSEREVIDYYAKEMASRGWKLSLCDNCGEKKDDTSSSTMSFAKADKAALVIVSQPQANVPSRASDGLPIRSIFLAMSDRAPASLKTQGKDAHEGQPGGLPSHDLPGDDIASVPRYPGAVRLTTMNMQKGGQLISYYTHDGGDEVLEFYRQQMPPKQWSLVHEADFSDVPQAIEDMQAQLQLQGKSLVFASKQYGSCFISVARVGESSPISKALGKATLISIKYDKK